MPEPVISALSHRALGVLIPPTRLPRLSGLRRALLRRRLPAYEALTWQLRGLADQGWMAHLWQEVFGERPAAGDPWEDLRAFARRVDRERFPVDLWATDQVTYDAEQPLWEPIYIGGRGVPWEVLGLEGLDHADRPLVAVVCTAGVPARGIPARAEWDAEPGQFGDRVLAWWQAQGYDAAHIPALTWPRDPAVAVALLGSLEPPLDGLATLYQGVVKGTGNPFLDLPTGYWQGDYVRWDWDWHWDVLSIVALTQHFRQVRPGVERLQCYYTWWDQAPHPAATVLATLVELEESAL